MSRVESQYVGVERDTMATQVFKCPIHGEFDVNVPLTRVVPKWRCCPVFAAPSHPLRCGRKSPWVLKPPSGVILRGDRPIDPGFTRDAQQLAAEKLRAKQQKARA